MNNQNYNFSNQVNYQGGAYNRVPPNPIPMNNMQQPPKREHPEDAFGSLSDWVATVLISKIPIVGFIFLMVWAFGSDKSSLYRKNYAKSLLIIGGIVFGFALLIYGIIFAVAMLTIPAFNSI